MKRYFQELINIKERYIFYGFHTEEKKIDKQYINT